MEKMSPNKDVTESRVAASGKKNRAADATPTDTGANPPVYPPAPTGLFYNRTDILRVALQTYEMFLT